MRIHQAFKFRLYPNAVQRRDLARQFGCSRFVYNTFLQQRMDFYAAHQGEKKQGLNYHDTALRLTALKRQPEYAWLHEVNSQALQVALRNLDTAYRNFFEGRGKYPKFKSRRARQSFGVPQHFALDAEQGQLILPKLTPLKIVMHRPVVGRPKSVTVSKSPSGRYFASILCEVEWNDRPLKGRGKEIGLDLGLKSFAVTSAGEKIDPAHFLRQLEYKAAWYGCRLEAIGPFFPSSQWCSNGDYRNVDLTLAEREWDCPVCHAHHDRDVNAALNILREGRARSVMTRRAGTARTTVRGSPYGKRLGRSVQAGRVDEPGSSPL